MGIDKKILQVIFFRTEAGNEPVRDWLLEHDKETRWYCPHSVYCDAPADDPFAWFQKENNENSCVGT